MTLYEVTTKFYLDHSRRCDICLDGNPLKVVKIGKVLTVLDLDGDMYADLYSDADYYASYDPECGEDDMKALKATAKATLNRLKKRG